MINIPPIVVEMLDAAQKSCENLRKQTSNIRYGKPGFILFEFKNITYQVKEPRDIMPVGYGDARGWALKMILDDCAKPL